jgi:hypothetical protein
VFGLFKSKSGGTPRWGFSVGWDDYVAAVREQLERRGLTLDDGAWKRGRVELPETADYEEWDLRAVTERCRELEPQEWEPLLEESLAEALGSPGPAVPELVEQVDPMLAAVLEADPVLRAAMYLDEEVPVGQESDQPTGARFDPPLERDHIRVQFFNGELAATFSAAVAKRPLGDAAMILVADMGFAEATLQWSDVEALGLSRDEAFAVGRENGARVMAGTVQGMEFTLPGARGSIIVSNGFFLGAAMFEIRDRLPAGTPVITAPISWHHWIQFELEAGATRATLTTMRDFVAQVAEGITTISNVSAWVTRSLWWWPAGATEPVVIDDAALPEELAARLA